MAADDEAGLAKLKLLFWRHLDWRERIKVLVKADALPLRRIGRFRRPWNVLALRTQGSRESWLQFGTHARVLTGG